MAFGVLQEFELYYVVVGDVIITAFLFLIEQQNIHDFHLKQFYKLVIFFSRPLSSN